MENAGIKWPPEYREMAIKEGWDIFETDGAEADPWKNDVLLINRDDQAAIFDSDNSALAHVIEKAKSGNPVHIKALELHMSLRGDK